MSVILDKLKAYFAKNSAEQVLLDWESTKEFDEVGITVDDFMLSVQIPYHLPPDSPQLCANMLSPEFSLGFFIKKVS